MRKFLMLAAILPLMSILPGCLSYQSMRLHYAVVNVDEPNPQVKFYRVTLRGYSSNVKANMNTGYYDANTLRYLYGDVQRDASNGGATGGGSNAIASASSIVKNNVPPGQMVFQFDPATRTWSQVPSTSLFTMIYGADSQALSDAIKSYADNDQAGVAMGRLFARAAGGDSFDQAVSAEQQQQTVAANAKKVDSAIGTLTSSLTNSIAKAVPPAAPAVPLPSPDQVDQQLLAPVQQAITLLGSGTTLSTANPTDGFSQATQVYQLLNQNPTK